MSYIHKQIIFRNKNTFGFARAEVLGALSNAVFLVALCFSILVEALKVTRHLELVTLDKQQL
jgi:zinc transporter 1